MSRAVAVGTRRFSRWHVAQSLARSRPSLDGSVTCHRVAAGMRSIWPIAAGEVGNLLAFVLSEQRFRERQESGEDHEHDRAASHAAAQGGRGEREPEHAAVELHAGAVVDPVQHGDGERRWTIVVATTAPSSPQVGISTRLSAMLTTRPTASGSAPSFVLLGAPDVVLGDDQQRVPHAVGQRPRHHGEAVVVAAFERDVEQQRREPQHDHAGGEHAERREFEHQVEPIGDAFAVAGFPIVAEVRHHDAGQQVGDRDEQAAE